VRQVIFLTDGDLSNEKDMMAEIAAHGGRSRVFMVGIGSAPNNFLMRRMAEAGRGTYTNIGDGTEVNAKMTALLDRLEGAGGARSHGHGRWRAARFHAAPPARSLCRRTAGAAGAGAEPVRPPDGQRHDRRQAVVANGGPVRRRGQPCRRSANNRVAEIEAARAAGETEDDQADGQIAELGLAYSLVTSQTSLVAVDETPTRPAGARLTREELPLLLPAGWDFDTLFNGAAAHATPPAAGAEAGEAEAVTLRAATGYMALVEKGSLALLMGVALLLAGTRRKARA
jgi:Ca-activated chloride channel family protein